MKNKRFWMGMLVLTLVFGMTVVGCEGEDKSIPYSQSIEISVDGSSWDSTTGSVRIWFQTPVEVNGPTYTGTPAEISVEDLQWLDKSAITFALSNANNRTLSITEIEEIKEYNRYSTFVRLKLTRSAIPPIKTEDILDTGKATVSITLPNDFTAKYPDGITWGNKQFEF
jgi:hypothetical protein